MARAVRTTIRLVVPFVLCFVVLMTGQFLYGAGPIDDNWVLRLVVAAGTVVGAVMVYRLFVSMVEHRTPTELSADGAVREVAVGVVIGAALLGVTVGILWIADLYDVLGRNEAGFVGSALALALMAGVCEELLFRGILFRIAEERLGTWIAFVISALLFGLLHLGNEDATIVSALVIALEAGVLLGAAFVLTRRLWLAIGIHVAWNFTQSGIFGSPVSGVESDGLLRSELLDPAWVSGGDFGIELSIVAIVLCVLCSALFVLRAVKRGHTTGFAAARAAVAQPA